MCYCLKICLNSPWHLAGYRIKLFPICAEKDTLRLHCSSYTLNMVPVECLVLYMKDAFCSTCGSMDYAHTIEVLGMENI